MEANIIREVERSILGGLMDLAILSMLYHDGGPASGYDVIKYLHRRFGFLPSAGLVYSHLYGLERESLLSGWSNGRKRVYSLTQRGKEKSKMIVNAGDRISKFVSIILQKDGC